MKEIYFPTETDFKAILGKIDLERIDNKAETVCGGACACAPPDQDVPVAVRVAP